MSIHGNYFTIPFVAEKSPSLVLGVPQGLLFSGKYEATETIEEVSEGELYAFLSWSRRLCQGCCRREA